jgi:hypothetical protein
LAGLPRRYESTETRRLPLLLPRGERECFRTPTALPEPDLRRRLARPRVAIRQPPVVPAVPAQTHCADGNVRRSPTGCRGIRSRGHPISNSQRSPRRRRHPDRPPLLPTRQSRNPSVGLIPEAQ